MIVPKQNGSLSFSVYYRNENLVTISDAYPIPKMDDFIDYLGDSNKFTTLDCNFSYCQIQIREGYEDKTSFKYLEGTYLSNLITFGLNK